jgi:Zn finger protein HypA/HybF involved in hydrogenase expression
MEKTDINLDEIVDTVECQDCQKTFNIRLGEKLFYQTKGLFYPPKRCPQCRKIRRLTIDGGRYARG